jgi:hypothetical protein
VGGNPKKSTENHWICQFSGSAFERDPRAPNAEPEPEPGVRFRFGSGSNRFPNRTLPPLDRIDVRQHYTDQKARANVPSNFTESESRRAALCNDSRSDGVLRRASCVTFSSFQVRVRS